MSVLIKGMEMPDKCGHCRFATAFDCMACGKFINNHDTRSDFCPLVSVPPHGDLIDAEEQMRLMQSYEYDTYDDYNRAFDMLDNAPTVIPGDKPKEAGT